MEDHIFEAAGGRWRLLSCEICKCAYLNPRPTSQTIGRAYQTYYTHEKVDFETSPPPDIGWLKRALANSYRNRIYKTKLRPTFGAFGSSILQLSRKFRAIIETETAGLLGVVPNNPGISILLDVGCGSGFALNRARSIGWQIMGIEPDPKAANAAAAIGVQIIATDILQLSLKFNGAFERILLNHVIEHVHDPIAVLRRCKELLTPEGELWLETPNVESTGHALFGIDWRGLEPPRHLVIFSLQSIQLALEKAEFRSVTLLKPRDGLDYMSEQSTYIRQKRFEKSGKNFLPTEGACLAELNKLARTDSTSISKRTERSDFLTLTARR